MGNTSSSASSSMHAQSLRNRVHAIDVLHLHSEWSSISIKNQILTDACPGHFTSTKKDFYKPLVKAIITHPNVVDVTLINLGGRYVYWEDQPNGRRDEETRYCGGFETQQGMLNHVLCLKKRFQAVASEFQAITRLYEKGGEASVSIESMQKAFNSYHSFTETASKHAGDFKKLDDGDHSREIAQVRQYMQYYAIPDHDSMIFQMLVNQRSSKTTTIPWQNRLNLSDLSMPSPAVEATTGSEVRPATTTR